MLVMAPALIPEGEINGEPDEHARRHAPKYGGRTD